MGLTRYLNAKSYPITEIGLKNGKTLSTLLTVDEVAAKLNPVPRKEL